MDGEIWDEERWEAFLKENDRRIEYFMSVLFRFMTDHPPAGPRGSESRRAWEVRLRAYLAGNGINPDDVLPRQFPDLGAGLDPSTRDLDPGAETNPGGEEDPDGRADFDPLDPLFHVDATLLHREEEGPLDDVRNLPIYQVAHQLTIHVLKWANSLPGHVKDSGLVQFCSFVMQVPANIAKGHELGYELDTIGGNIACAKRALAAANSALELLPELRSASYMDRTLYKKLYEESYEARNQIALHVQELRARFELGID